MVGRITGMFDCRWAKWSVVSGQWSVVSESEIPNPKSQIPNQELLVPLGAKFNLISGFMEITYDTGAKVILQGPVTYEIESPSGGFLSFGKLTARVEKDKETRRRGDKEKSSGAMSPPLLVSLSPCLPAFTVRTPTAIVTDLGTEFGVEVDRSGASRAHVFRGRIELRSTGGGKADRFPLPRSGREARRTRATCPLLPVRTAAAACN